MNIWAIIAVIAALIFGVCIGFIVAYAMERHSIAELKEQCRECSEKLSRLSTEYEEFVNSVHNEADWPSSLGNMTMSDNLANYLKMKYLNTELESDLEDESDDMYV